MWKFLKDNRRMIALTVVALLCGMVIGLWIGLSIEPDGEQLAQTGNVGVASVLPTTRMARGVLFEKCGHTLDASLSTDAFIGYTQSELETFYPDASVVTFSAEQVYLRQSIDAFCPEHFELRLEEDGALCIFQTDPKLFTENLVQTLDAALVDDMSPSDRNCVRNGLGFDSLADIDSYLESAES